MHIRVERSEQEIVRERLQLSHSKPHRESWGRPLVQQFHISLTMQRNSC